MLLITIDVLSAVGATGFITIPEYPPVVTGIAPTGTVNSINSFPVAEPTAPVTGDTSVDKPHLIFEICTISVAIAVEPSTAVAFI